MNQFLSHVTIATVFGVWMECIHIGGSLKNEVLIFLSQRLNQCSTFDDMTVRRFHKTKETQTTSIPWTFRSILVNYRFFIWLYDI